MKILIRGLHRDVTEAMLRDKIKGYAPIIAIEIVREGDADQPWALVDLAVDPVAAWDLLRRFDKQYWAGRHMRWHIAAHQG